MQCMDRASLEDFLGRGLSLAEIGQRVGRHEATVAYWAKRYGLQAVNQQKHSARGGLDETSWRGLSIKVRQSLRSPTPLGAVRRPSGIG